MTELDRVAQRPFASIHAITRKRLQLYADAEGDHVATAAARLVRLGFEQHDFIDQERVKCSREVFRQNYKLPPSPEYGEGVRLKVPLEEQDIERAVALAEREFETIPTILNRLLLWGFQTIPHSHPYWRKWDAYLSDKKRTP
jgi:hypothetical protein